MTDPKHLADEQPGALGQLLVRAAQDEEPPVSLLERTLGALSESGVATVSSTAGTVGVSPAPSAAAGAGVLTASAKYAGLAAVSVLAAGLALDATITPMMSQSPAE